MRKILEILSKNWFCIGMFSAIFVIIPFMRIVVDGDIVELSSIDQLVFFNSLFLIIVSIVFFQNKNGIFYFLDITSILFLSLLVVSIVSSFIGVDPISSLRRIAISFVPAFFIYFTGSCCSDPHKMFRGFVLGLSWVSLISVLYALIGFIAEYSNLGPAGEHGTIVFFGLDLAQNLGQRQILIFNNVIELQRFSGLFPNPNGLGMVSVLCLVMLVTLKTDMPKTYYFLSLIMILGLLLSGSRMSFILLLFSFLSMFLFSRIGVRNTGLIAVFIILSCSIFLLVASPFYDFLLDRVGLNGQEFLTLGERGEVFLKAGEVMTGNWLFGNGFGIGADVVFGDHAASNAVHSVFLNALVETGLIGLLLLVTLWIQPVLTLQKGPSRGSSENRTAKVICAALIGLLFAEMFDLSITRFHYLHLIFFLLLGISTALQRPDRRAMEG